MNSHNVFPQMRAALGKGDLVGLGRLGHRMKGTVVYLGVKRAEEAASGVERFCQREGKLAEAEKAVNALDSPMPRAASGLARAFARGPKSAGE